MTELRLSGGGHNTSPAFSLGGEISGEEITSDVNHNLFDKVKKLEILNEKEEFRCIYVYNETSSEVRNMIIKKKTIEDFTTIAIGVEDGTAQIIPNEGVTPSNVVFYDLDEYLYLNIPIGNLKPSEGKAVWIRRSLSNGVVEGEFELTFEWTALGFTPDESIVDKLSMVENIKVIEIEYPSRMGRFKIGQGVMG